jgi:dihydroorotate dehydrogenase
MYKLLRNFLFLFPPEGVHHFSMRVLKFWCGIPVIKRMVVSSFCLPGSPEKLGQPATIFGLTFKNRVGLAAGFDKNALYLRELEALGFGYVEIGTVTPVPQAGNEQPRLFRLPKDRSLINRMGFNNDGVKVVAKRLRHWKQQHHSNLIIGGNIGKNKITPNEEAWKDYETCFRELFDCVDYFVVNVSSPNTPGLRALQEKEALKKILTHLQSINVSFATQKPILLKIAPDLTTSQIDDVVALALEIKLDGLVAANTSIGREGLQTSSQQLQKIGAGGLSGAPLKERSNEIVQQLHNHTHGTVPIIASGGIFTAADAKDALDCGASLVQVWTGFIYEGPGIVKKIIAG